MPSVSILNSKLLPYLSVSGAIYSRSHHILTCPIRNFWNLITFHLTIIEFTVNRSLKVKVKLFLCSFLTERNAMKAYWGVEV
jgi:hypothetical protein